MLLLSNGFGMKNFGGRYHIAKTGMANGRRLDTADSGPTRFIGFDVRVYKKRSMGDVAASTAALCDRRVENTF